MGWFDWWSKPAKDVACPQIPSLPTTTTAPPIPLPPSTPVWDASGLPAKLPDESNGAFIERMLRMEPHPPGMEAFIRASLGSEPTPPPASSSPPKEPDAADVATGHTVSKTISDATLNRAIQIESAGDPNAKAATSSALGLGQFLAATWLALIGHYKAVLFKAKTSVQVLALRRDPKLSIEMLARLWEENAAYLQARKVEVYDGSLYLAHFLGPDAAAKVAGAPITAPVSKYVSAAAITANRSILSGKTCGAVTSWATSKMATAGDRGYVRKYYS